jgi:hypothetical protein
VADGLFPHFFEGSETKLKRRISLYKSDMSNLLNPSVFSVGINFCSVLMKNNRNDLVHRPKGGLSEEERETFFQESFEIACRVDNFIGESTSINSL